MRGLKQSKRTGRKKGLRIGMLILAGAAVWSLLKKRSETVNDQPAATDGSIPEGANLGMQ